MTYSRLKASGAPHMFFWVVPMDQTGETTGRRPASPAREPREGYRLRSVAFSGFLAFLTRFEATFWCSRNPKRGREKQSRFQLVLCPGSVYFSIHVERATSQHRPSRRETAGWSRPEGRLAGRKVSPKTAGNCGRRVGRTPSGDPSGSSSGRRPPTSHWLVTVTDREISHRRVARPAKDDTPKGESNRRAFGPTGVGRKTGRRL